MATKRTVDVFTAGCPLCEEAVDLVRRMACPSCSVIVHSMQDHEARVRAREIGVRSLPAVAVDGTLASCCTAGGVDEPGLRAAGVGRPL